MDLTGKSHIFCVDLDSYPACFNLFKVYYKVKRLGLVRVILWRKVIITFVACWTRWTKCWTEKPFKRALIALIAKLWHIYRTQIISGNANDDLSQICICFTICMQNVHLSSPAVYKSNIVKLCKHNVNRFRNNENWFIHNVKYIVHNLNYWSMCGANVVAAKNTPFPPPLYSFCHFFSVSQGWSRCVCVLFRQN